MTHPLNDEMCDALKETWGGIGFSHHDMRAAYDKGADRQLEQVIEWVKHCRGYRLELASETWNFVQDLKEAMRPQEES